MAFRISRGVWILCRPRHFGAGTKGSICFHSASVRSVGYPFFMRRSVRHSPVRSFFRQFQSRSSRKLISYRHELSSWCLGTRVFYCPRYGSIVGCQHSSKKDDQERVRPAMSTTILGILVV